MINKKLIHFNTYSAFEENKSQLYDWTIAFIGETKQIYTHGNFYDCDIEDINELNDKIDEILEDIYVDGKVDATNGVYIQAIDGLLYTEADWDGSKTANGIAVVTDNCQFVMALQDAYSSYCRWGGYSTEVSGITTTMSSSTAKTDYDGEANTTTIINALNGTNDGYVDGAPAAEYCRAYTFPNGATGYMGAAGEWQAALDNKDAITSALSTCGGTAMSNYYWTSTQYSSSNSWYVDWSDEFLSINLKDDNNSVRAFAALPTATVPGKQSLKDKLAELEQSLSLKGNIQAVDTTESVDDPDITYLTTSKQSLTSAELEQVQSNLGIDDKQDIITKIDVAGGDIVKTISPNIYYVWHAPTSLSITLGAETSPFEYNEYMFEIICGDTAPTVTLPDTISWVSDPVIEASKTYQISIVNNIGLIVSV